MDAAPTSKNEVEQLRNQVAERDAVIEQVRRLLLLGKENGKQAQDTIDGALMILAPPRKKVPKKVQCPNCNGTGNVRGEVCPRCKGSREIMGMGYANEG